MSQNMGTKIGKSMGKLIKLDDKLEEEMVGKRAQIESGSRYYEATEKIREGD